MSDRSRRLILKLSLTMPTSYLLGLMTSLSPLIAVGGDKLDDVTVHEWFTELMSESAVYKDFGSALDLRRFKDPMYVVLADLVWKPVEPKEDLQPVTVPRGFVTDLASVPLPFWSIFRPDGDYAYAAILHDYLYWIQDRSRKHADAVFRSAMDELKINDFQALVLYSAVKKFGESAWRKNKELKAAGERRLLDKLPDRSDITWSEWKVRGNIN